MAIAQAAGQAFNPNKLEQEYNNWNEKNGDTTAPKFDSNAPDPHTVQGRANAAKAFDENNNEKDPASALAEEKGEAREAQRGVEGSFTREYLKLKNMEDGKVYDQATGKMRDVSPEEIDAQKKKVVDLADKRGLNPDGSEKAKPAEAPKDEKKAESKDEKKSEAAPKDDKKSEAKSDKEEKPKEEKAKGPHPKGWLVRENKDEHVNKIDTSISQIDAKKREIKDMLKDPDGNSSMPAADRANYQQQLKTYEEAQAELQTARQEAKEGRVGSDKYNAAVNKTNDLIGNQDESETQLDGVPANHSIFSLQRAIHHDAVSSSKPGGVDGWNGDYDQADIRQTLGMVGINPGEEWNQDKKYKDDH